MGNVGAVVCLRCAEKGAAVTAEDHGETERADGTWFRKCSACGAELVASPAAFGSRAVCLGCYHAENPPDGGRRTDERAIQLIIAELEDARSKHPQWPQDVVHQAAIVSEESGELIRAALQFEYESTRVDEVDEAAANMDLEAIQTAAMCIRMLVGG
jgi:hypothetical protein